MSWFTGSVPFPPVVPSITIASFILDDEVYNVNVTLYNVNFFLVAGSFFIEWHEADMPNDLAASCKINH